MTYFIIALLVWSLILNIFLLIKFYYNERDLRSLFKWSEKTEITITKLMRSLSRNQSQVFTQQSCAVCGTLLPEDYVPTHDRKFLCNEHKSIE